MFTCKPNTMLFSPTLNFFLEQKKLKSSRVMSRSLSRMPLKMAHLPFPSWRQKKIRQNDISNKTWIKREENSVVLSSHVLNVKTNHLQASWEILREKKTLAQFFCFSQPLFSALWKDFCSRKGEKFSVFVCVSYLLLLENAPKLPWRDNCITRLLEDKWKKFALNSHFFISKTILVWQTYDLISIVYTKHIQTLISL